VLSFCKHGDIGRLNVATFFITLLGGGGSGRRRRCFVNQARLALKVHLATRDQPMDQEAIATISVIAVIVGGAVLAQIEG
jgi:hypothetical protein